MDDGVHKLEILGCVADKAAVTQTKPPVYPKRLSPHGNLGKRGGKPKFFKGRLDSDPGDNLCSLHIDKESSRIDIFKSRGVLVLSPGYSYRDQQHDRCHFPGSGNR